MGFRPNQKTLKLGCPVNIVASVDRTADMMVVREVNLTHNHTLSDDVSLLKTTSELSMETKEILNSSGQITYTALEQSGVEVPQDGSQEVGNGREKQSQKRKTTGTKTT